MKSKLKPPEFNDDGSQPGFEHITKCYCVGKERWQAIWRGRPARGTFTSKGAAEAWIERCDFENKWRV